MKLKDNVYNILKWIMLLAAPVATCILGVISAVKTHDASAIVTSVFGGIGTIAGVIIKISDGNYRKELPEEIK